MCVPFMPAFMELLRVILFLCVSCTQGLVRERNVLTKLHDQPEGDGSVQSLGVRIQPEGHETVQACGNIAGIYADTIGLPVTINQTSCAIAVSVAGSFVYPGTISGQEVKITSFASSGRLSENGDISFLDGRAWVKQACRNVAGVYSGLRGEPITIGQASCAFIAFKRKGTDGERSWTGEVTGSALTLKNTLSDGKVMQNGDIAFSDGDRWTKQACGDVSGTYVNKKGDPIVISQRHCAVQANVTSSKSFLFGRTAGKLLTFEHNGTKANVTAAGDLEFSDGVMWRKKVLSRDDAFKAPKRRIPAKNSSVCVSVLAPASEKWLAALVANLANFLLPTTRVALHLGSRPQYSPDVIARWMRAMNGRITITPQRYELRQSTDSNLFAHLANVLYLNEIFPGQCSHFVMQPRQMMWVRPGMEEQVKKRGYSNLVVLQHTVPMPISSPMYQEVYTGKSLAAWGKTAGAFFPLHVGVGTAELILRSLNRTLQGSDAMVDDKYNLEEYLLQTYSVNYAKPLPPKYVFHPTSVPLCWQNTIGNITEDQIRMIADGKGGMWPYYAVMPIRETLDDNATSFLMSLPGPPGQRKNRRKHRQDGDALSSWLQRTWHLLWSADMMSPDMMSAPSEEP